MNRSYFVATLAALPFCTSAIAATAPQYTLIDLGENEYIGQGMIWADRTIEDINGFVPTPAPCTLGNHNFQFTPVLMSGQSFISVGSGCTKNGSHAVKWTNTENVEGTVLTDVGSCRVPWRIAVPLSAPTKSATSWVSPQQHITARSPELPLTPSYGTAAI
jgi:hypothetical protein